MEILFQLKHYKILPYINISQFWSTLFYNYYWATRIWLLQNMLSQQLIAEKSLHVSSKPDIELLIECPVWSALPYLCLHQVEQVFPAVILPRVLLHRPEDLQFCRPHRSHPLVIHLQHRDLKSCTVCTIRKRTTQRSQYMYSVYNT